MKMLIRQISKGSFEERKREREREKILYDRVEKKRKQKKERMKKILCLPHLI